MNIKAANHGNIKKSLQDKYIIYMIGKYFENRVSLHNLMLILIEKL